MRNPFIAGSWVGGDNFFGRSAMLAEILEGDRDSLWVVGARRIGKTSLLKQLEYRVQQSTLTPFVPIYWDLQGRQHCHVPVLRLAQSSLSIVKALNLRLILRQECIYSDPRNHHQRIKGDGGIKK